MWLEKCSVSSLGRQSRTPDVSPRWLDIYRSINALAETIIGLYKTEVIEHEGPWNGPADVEVATLDWVHWFNHHRLLEPIGDMPPAEFEQAYYQHSQAIA